MRSHDFCGSIWLYRVFGLKSILITHTPFTSSCEPLFTHSTNFFVFQAKRLTKSERRKLILLSFLRHKIFSQLEYFLEVRKIKPTEIAPWSFEIVVSHYVWQIKSQAPNPIFCIARMKYLSDCIYLPCNGPQLDIDLLTRIATTGRKAQSSANPSFVD